MHSQEKKSLENLPRIASKIGAALKGKNLLPEREQILSFKSCPYGKEAKYFILGGVSLLQMSPAPRTAFSNRDICGHSQTIAKFPFSCDSFPRRVTNIHKLRRPVRIKSSYACT